MLERDIDNKDRDISELKESVRERDERIEDLERQVGIVTSTNVTLESVMELQRQETEELKD